MSKSSTRDSLHGRGDSRDNAPPDRSAPNAPRETHPETRGINYQPRPLTSLRFLSTKQEQVGRNPQPAYASMSARFYLGGDRSLKPYATTLLVFAPILDFDKDQMSAQLKDECLSVLRAQVEMETGLLLSDADLARTEWLAIWEAGSIQRRTTAFMAGYDTSSTGTPVATPQALPRGIPSNKELRALVARMKREATISLDAQRAAEESTEQPDQERA